MITRKIVATLFLFTILNQANAARHVLFYVPPASNDLQQAFIRIVNPSSVPVSFSIDAIDDSGTWSPTSLQNLTIAANGALQVNSIDIENGNSNKGLPAGFGTGDGNWRLIINSESDLNVMSYIRTPDGFLNDMHDVVGGAPFQLSHSVPIFNPASNANQKSRIRISNDTNTENTIMIYGYDDSGEAAGPVILNMDALEASELESTDLENGNPSKGLTGSLGDGIGKWRLEIFSSESSTIVNLLELPGGYISNLSGKSDDGTSDDATVDPTTNIYEASVLGTFNGWYGDTIVQLNNGQIWQQSVYYYEYDYGFNQNVLVYQSFGAWKMWIEGIDKPVTVVRLQ